MTSGTRRTSGEIINATLLEVFLALTFVVFSAAVYEKGLRVTAEAKVDSAAVTAGKMRESAEELKVARAQIAGLLDAVDSLTAKSKIPPNCEPGAEPLEVVTITLDTPDRLLVRPTRGVHGLDADALIAIPPAVLASRFVALQLFGSENHNCKFVARVIDKPSISKADLKRLCSRIQTVFRVIGCFT